MRANTTRITIIMTAAALVAALATPMVAGAVPGQGGKWNAPAKEQVVAAKGAFKAQALENLKKRIANVLMARKARFDAATSNLNMRIERVSAIADRVEKAGGDVSSARESLDSAKEHLAKADTLEQAAIASFESILDSANRGVAFKAARAKARLAIAEIKLARADVRAAAQGLRQTVAQLKTQPTQ